MNPPPLRGSLARYARSARVIGRPLARCPNLAVRWIGELIRLTLALVEFESDPDKAEYNLRTHKVSFNEAATVFGDPLSMTIADPDHSSEENRLLTIGLRAESPIDH